jgi:hypothetical protein
MQKQTSIYIPKPCHEDWNKMTPMQQGKFCSSCNKQVVDFSLMSDNQVLNYLAQHSGKLCGRFDAEQLQRPLVETKIKKQKSWWMALTMPLLFLFERGEAQDNKITGDTIYNVTNSNASIGDWLKNKKPICGTTKELTGTVRMTTYKLSKQTTIIGKVIDHDNNQIAYATIMQKGTKHGTVSDSLGNFSIDINSDDNNVTLVASYVGYETIEKQIDLKTKHLNITMKSEPTVSGELVVVGYAIMRKTSGLISTVACTRAFNEIDTAVRKAFNLSAFKIYPSPAINGSTIHIEIKKAGEYQMQLLDNQSGLVQAQELNIVSDKSITPIQLPTNIASGIYYLRLIDEQKKRSYTEKLVIQ